MAGNPLGRGGRIAVIPAPQRGHERKRAVEAFREMQCGLGERLRIRPGPAGNRGALLQEIQGMPDTGNLTMESTSLIRLGGILVCFD